MDTPLSRMSTQVTNVMLSGLMGRGFTLDQAVAFLPDASHLIVSVIKENGGIINTETVIKDIDVAVLAIEVGIDASKIKDGLKFMIPGIVEQSSSANGNDLLGKINNLK